MKKQQTVCLLVMKEVLTLWFITTIIANILHWESLLVLVNIIFNMVLDYVITWDETHIYSPNAFDLSPMSQTAELQKRPC